VAGAVVDNLIDERRWEVVFGTCIVEIVKVGANANGALFFVDGYRVGNPRRISDGVNESSRAQFVVSALIAAALAGCSGRCFWRTGVMSGQVSMRCSTIEGSMPGISVYDQANISRNSWKRAL
jgi:hypothetical protein